MVANRGVYQPDHEGRVEVEDPNTTSIITFNDPIAFMNEQ